MVINKKEIKLPPLPMPDQGRAFVRGIVEDDAKLESWCRAAIEAERKHTVDLIARYQEKIRSLEVENYALISELDDRQARGEPVDATLVAHTDLLTYVLQGDVSNRLTPRVVDIAYTAFIQAKRPNDEDGGASDWFNDTKPAVMQAIEKIRKDLFADRATKAPHPAEPVKVLSNVEATQPTETALGDKGDIAGWLRRRADYPIVSIPGRLAGEIADHIESLSEKDADHLRDATKMIEPVKVPSENDLWPKGETRYFCDRCSMTLGAEVVLEIAKDFNPAQTIDHARRIEGEGE